MRLVIRLKSDRLLTIPINYNHQLASSIYSTIRTSSPEYSEFLHNDGYKLGLKTFKMFTFSQLISDSVKVENGMIQFLSDEIVWHISSPISEFMINLSIGLLTNGHVRLSFKQDFQDIDIPVLSVLSEPEMQFSNVEKFITLSPITISTTQETDGKLSKRYLRPDDPLIPELIVRNLKNKYRIFQKTSPDDFEIQFSFDTLYMERKNWKITKLIEYSGIRILGINAPFTLEGNSELIRLAYDAGVGDSNSQGFGCIKRVNLTRI